MGKQVLAELEGEGLISGVMNSSNGGLECGV